MGELEKLKQDCIVKQKRGLHIMIASIVVWGGILAVELLNIPIRICLYGLTFTNILFHISID